MADTSEKRSARSLSERWHGWRRQPSAPPPGRKALAVLLALLVPTGLGAALDWPAWLSIALCVPALVADRRARLEAARGRGLTSRDYGPQWVGAILGAVGGPTGVLMANVASERYFGLALPGIMLVFGLIERWLWWRYDKRVSRPPAHPRSAS
jgi:hypothetical protein